jgi:hypothetical protein
MSKIKKHLEETKELEKDQELNDLRFENMMLIEQVDILKEEKETLLNQITKLKNFKKQRDILIERLNRLERN